MNLVTDLSDKEFTRAIDLMSKLRRVLDEIDKKNKQIEMMQQQVWDLSMSAAAIRQALDKIEKGEKDD